MIASVASPLAGLATVSLTQPPRSCMDRSRDHGALDHDWSLSWDQARRLQESLAAQVSPHDELGELRTVAGIDLGHPRTASGGGTVRTGPGSGPISVSVGHRVSLETATSLVIACAGGFRLPEPVRQADRLASQRTPRRRATGGSEAP